MLVAYPTSSLSTEITIRRIHKSKQVSIIFSIITPCTLRRIASVNGRNRIHADDDDNFYTLYSSPTALQTIFPATRITIIDFLIYVWHFAFHQSCNIGSTKVKWIYLYIRESASGIARAKRSTHIYE